MANVLVTGVAGFIGSHTADALLAKGHRVWGIDNFRTGNRGNLENALRQGLEFGAIDMLDAGRVSRFIKGKDIDVVIHLGALVSVAESITDPDLNFRLNVEATHGIAEVARRHQVRRLVFASSAAVYGNEPALPVKETASPSPISPYGSAKLASEHLLLCYASTHGMVVRVQRYFNVFGPRQDVASPYSGVISIFTKELCGGRAVSIHGDGRQTRDFVNVADVARANVLAATKRGLATGVANICTGRSVSLRRLVSTLRGLCPGTPPPRFAAARPGDIRHSLGSPQRAKAQLGFRAERSLEAGLRELVRAVRAAE